MSDDLAQRRCEALDGGTPMTSAEIERHLALLSGWRHHDGAIEKSFAFPDYAGTMAFVNALAWIADAQDHHPELRVAWGRCTVRFDTHSVGGISINDFICAAKADALVAAVG